MFQTNINTNAGASNTTQTKIFEELDGAIAEAIA